MMQHTLLCIDAKVLTKNTNLTFGKPYEGVFIAVNEDEVVFIETEKGGKQ